MGSGLDYHIYSIFQALSFVMSVIMFLGSKSFIGMDPLAMVSLMAKQLGMMASRTISSVIAGFAGLI